MQIKVLVVEDDQHTRHGLAEILRQEGCIVVQASNGVQGWESFSREHPDFVCLDVMLPGMSGYELCKKIRGSDCRTPIMFLTAKSEEIDRVLGLELGADDYLCKPFGLKEVVARIRAITRRTLGDRINNGLLGNDGSRDIPPQFVLGDLTCYPHQLRCRRGDEPLIDVSLRDVKILWLLFQYAGQVVDRRTMMERCWEQAYFPSSRSLDQHISQLRKRIERDPKSPLLIQTIHGVGYRYDP